MARPWVAAYLWAQQFRLENAQRRALDKSQQGIGTALNKGRARQRKPKFVTSLSARIAKAVRPEKDPGPKVGPATMGKKPKKDGWF